MKISKLFHWLYAILMFLPFGLLVYNALASMWSGSTITSSEWFDTIFVGNFSTFNNGLTSTIFDVYDYLCSDIFGWTTDFDYSLAGYIPVFLTYWTCISIIWLVFDVFMYVPLLVHRWIDKAKIE